MSEAITLTREYDGSYTVDVDRSLILSDLSRTTAHHFVATYRRLAAPSDTSQGAAETASTTGGRLGQVTHRKPAALRPLIRIARRQG